MVNPAIALEHSEWIAAQKTYFKMNFVVNTMARPNYKSFDKNGGLGMKVPSSDVGDIIPPQTQVLNPANAAEKSASALMSCGSRLLATVFVVLAVSAAAILF